MEYVVKRCKRKQSQRVCTLWQMVVKIRQIRGGHGDTLAWDATKGHYGSIVLLQLRSLLVSLAQFTTKGQADAKVWAATRDHVDI